MGMLGNKLQSAYTATVKDTLSGDGSTTVFTLSKPSRTNDVDVFVENVRQEPTVAYSVSGTTLTFTEAPASGTDNIYVIHRVQASQSLAVNTDDITDGAITSAKLAAGAVTDPTPAVVSGVDNTATDFFSLPRGTTAQRPVSPQNGYIRYNTTGDYLEEYRNGGWRILSDVFVASGGTEVTSGGYKYHTFTSSGTFTVSSGSSSIEYLIVAGGGSGGANYVGAGGGAGGLLQGSMTASGNLSITVGAGASGASGGAGTAGLDGSDSSIGSSIVAIGGGGGGTSSGATGVAGRSGGSGGGSGGYGSPTNGWGNGTSGQGNRGGAGWDGIQQFTTAGGGGGAGAVGGNASQSGTSDTSGGDGGIGLNYSTWATATSTGDSGYYAGGGGGSTDKGGGANYAGSGGTGGLGGGGTGATQASGTTSGAVNTGGGGGGLRSTGTSGAGGSGIVIIRYAV